MQSGFIRDHAEMARNMKADLHSFISELKEFVTELAQNANAMRAGFRNDHAEMAENLKDNLGTFVSGLKNGVYDMMSGFRRNRAEMAAMTSTERKLFLSELRQSVSDLRHEIAFLRNKFSGDISGARQAWSGLLQTEPKVIIKDQAETQPEEEFRIAEEPQPEETGSEVGKAETFVEEMETVEPEEAEIGEELIPDDFTVIRGIGVVRQNLLNEAGIFTYAQLAESNPEKLLQVLGPIAKTAMVEKWISQAGELKIDD